MKWGLKFRKKKNKKTRNVNQKRNKFYIKYKYIRQPTGQWVHSLDGVGQEYMMGEDSDGIW